MTKISLIGAGSVVFTRTLVSDILSFPALHACTIALMDIDDERLRIARDLVQALIDDRHVAARVEATTDRRAAIAGASFVIVTVQVGGLEAYRHDIDIPARYGVGQCVGDTLGPGGIFRGLRTIPVLQGICQDMDDLCSPDALLINYSNPMAINCWAIASASGRPHVGLCHSVQGTSEMLARFIEAPYSEISYLCAGINHQAWFLDLRWNGADAYPLLRERTTLPEIYGQEPVRIDLMRQFGSFVTESSGHASEYVPYFRKTPQQIAALAEHFSSPADHWFDWGRTGGYLKHCQERLPSFLDEVRAQIDGQKALPTRASHEYGAYIINAMVTGEPAVIYGNVPNTQLIANLPADCCVEVPCLVDRNGIQPAFHGSLPPQLAALNRTNINVQELTVYGALYNDREAIYHAAMLDPLTATVCDLPAIRAMVDDLFRAHARWLPPTLAQE